MTNKKKAIKLCKCNICTSREYCPKTLSDSCDKYIIAMKMAKWKDKQLIEKAFEWLKENIYNRVYECGDRLGFPTADFLEEFKKAMEEE